MLAGDVRLHHMDVELELAERLADDPLWNFEAHAKQQAFIEAVLRATYWETWLCTANRFGKTEAGLVCDATFARYGLDAQRPAIGTVWVEDRATAGWIIGPDYSTLTQVILPKLIDWPTIPVPPGQPHKPFIPRRELEYWDNNSQEGKLKNGSLIRAKSNEQQQIRFAAAGIDWAHFDEEPVYKNYEEVTLRVEAGRRLRVYCTCTLLPPEGQVGGVSWSYSKIIQPFQRGRNPGIGVFGGSIYDNPHLHPEEIARLEAKYPEGSPQRRIRLGGEWLPGIGGVQAYMHFRHNLHVRPQALPHPRMPLCWMLDFNVSPFVSLVGQYTPDHVFHFFRELIIEDSGDIQGMVELFRRYYPAHPHEVWVYGDATGGNRSVQTAESCYTLILRGMRDYPTPVKLCIPEANPYVGDRVNAVNQALRDERGQSRVEIDPSCEEFIADLEQVLSDSKGGVKKTTDRKDPYFRRTHTSDAGGYWIWQVAPVVQDAPREGSVVTVAQGAPFTGRFTQDQQRFSQQQQVVRAQGALRR